VHASDRSSLAGPKLDLAQVSVAASLQRSTSDPDD